jgi:hypothetical protein
MLLAALVSLFSNKQNPILDQDRPGSNVCFHHNPVARLALLQQSQGLVQLQQ